MRGEVKTWRLSGKLTMSSAPKAEDMPSSLALYVEYLFPYKAVVQAIEEDTNMPLDEKLVMLRQLDGYKINTWQTMVRTIPVYVWQKP